MTKKLDSCVKKINKKIKKGEIPKTFMRKGKRVKTNAHALCRIILSERESAINSTDDFFFLVDDLRGARGKSNKMLK